ncbi:hypothetical protein E2542_SST22389 [Spatholobus suberectus]|nr:hypothetical protein E2542_SST22389 [Spatholobus suberectus]
MVAARAIEELNMVNVNGVGRADDGKRMAGDAGIEARRSGGRRPLECLIQRQLRRERNSLVEFRRNSTKWGYRWCMKDCHDTVPRHLFLLSSSSVQMEYPKTPKEPPHGAYKKERKKPPKTSTVNMLFLPASLLPAPPGVGQSVAETVAEAAVVVEAVVVKAQL